MFLSELWDIAKLYKNSNLIKHLPRMDKASWHIWMRICDVYDGDTFTVICVQKGTLMRWRCRMCGYDSPELKSKDEGEKAAAIAARDFFKTLLPTRMFRSQCVGLDKYGRMLLDMKCKHSKAKIRDVMISNGHGVAYDGKKKTPFAERKVS